MSEIRDPRFAELDRMIAKTKDTRPRYVMAESGKVVPRPALLDWPPKRQPWKECRRIYLEETGRIMERRERKQA